MHHELDETVNTYRLGFQTYIARTPSEPTGEFKAWMDSFLSHIVSGGTIFELGSASGRDARYFSQRGYRVFCTDVIPEALAALAGQGFMTASFDFREKPLPEWIGSFDGVFANAVLLHATPAVFLSVLDTVLSLLRPGGVIAFSLKAGVGEEVTSEKMDAPRYFCYHTQEELHALLSVRGVDILHLDYADHGKWLHVIARKQ